MPKDDQVRDIDLFVPFLAKALAFGLQGARQSTAMFEVLRAKGLVTQQEIDEQMKSTEEQSKQLLAMLDATFGPAGQKPQGH